MKFDEEGQKFLPFTLDLWSRLEALFSLETAAKLKISAAASGDAKSLSVRSIFSVVARGAVFLVNPLLKLMVNHDTIRND